MAFLLFWYTFDDHLAAALNIPDLGDLPLWVVFLIGCALTPVTFHRSKDDD